MMRTRSGIEVGLANIETYIDKSDAASENVTGAVDENAGEEETGGEDLCEDENAGEDDAANENMNEPTEQSQ